MRSQIATHAQTQVMSRRRSRGVVMGGSSEQQAWRHVRECISGSQMGRLAHIWVQIQIRIQTQIWGDVAATQQERRSVVNGLKCRKQ